MKYIYMILAGTLAYFVFKNKEDIPDNFESQIIEASKKAFGKLSTNQINAIKALIFEWKVYNELDINKLIYIIATAWHESRLGFYPREIRAKVGTETYIRQNAYWTTGFYGRGLVQITWLKNYQKFSDLLKIDLVSNPELATQNEIAAKIAIIGMHEGLFTGRKLSDYITSTKADYYNARKSVNGLDKAELIESYGISIYQSLYGKVV